MLKKEFITILRNQLQVSPEFKVVKVKNLYNGLELNRRTKGVYSRVVVGLVPAHDYMLITGVGAEVRDDQVEKVITPLLQKEFLLGPSTNYKEQFTIAKESGHESIGSNLAEFRIKDSYAAALAIDKIIDSLRKHHIPFWDKFSNTHTIRKAILELPETDVENVLGAFGTLKKLVVLIIENDPGAMEYVNALILNQQNLVRSDPAEPNFKRKLRVLQELFQMIG